MFICTPCRIASDLHESLHKSRGECEVCYRLDVCDEIPPWGYKDTVLRTGRAD